MRKNIFLLAITAVASAGADDAAAVRAAATRWADAVVQRDRGALERLIASDFAFAYPDGRSVHMKADYIASLVAGEPRYESFYFTEPPLIMIDDDAAVLSGFLQMKEPMREPVRLRVMQVYVESTGEWQLAASASTAVRPPGAPGPTLISMSRGSARPPDYKQAEVVVKAVTEAALGWTDAAVRKDSAALGEYLADEMIFVHSNGSTIQNRNQYLSATARNTYEALPMSEVRVQSIGRAAVLTAYIDTKNIGRDPFRVRTFQVFVERGGKWRLTAFQSTRVAGTQGQ